MLGTAERNRFGRFQLRIAGLLGASAVLAGLTAVTASVQAQPPRRPAPAPLPYPVSRSYDHHNDRPGPIRATSFDTWRLWSLNNRLIEKTEWLLDNVAARRCGHEGWRVEANARELLDSARDLRRVLQRGGDPRLVFRQFADLKRDCDRLVALHDRYGRGGLNAPVIYEIGKTCALMRQTLGQTY